jgi:broad specificity phosphatase PhoE
MRHAEADYSHAERWNVSGWGADLAPLTPRGLLQIQERLPELLAFQPEIVLSSAISRALQTALEIRPHIHAPFHVEFDLHEWVPRRDFQWRTLQDVMHLQAEYDRNEGEWPKGEECLWESKSMMQARAMRVLERYSHYARVLVVCHGMLIGALTGTHWDMGNCEVREMELEWEREVLL